MIFLSLEDLLHVAERTLGEVLVRDLGLLESAVARPQTSVLGEDAYASLDEKAAALVHSLARNRALVDGNKRLALVGLIAFYGLNGRRLILSNEEAYDLIIAITSGEFDDVTSIATLLAQATEPRTHS
ncbi:MAG TPA: type II toxin-antitoxin system death-on-curing family toxin [Actinomycetes bacterium]|nr:type II toxin-antitoxin system death-on-curing family toxin [Actinomycetes bacterium]